MILCTCGKKEEAASIARTLVEERLAACVNVMPGIESVYRWRGKVESAEEVLLLVKTTEERFPAVRDRIAELHSYDTPEIIALPVMTGSENYLAWLRDQV